MLKKKLVDTLADQRNAIKSYSVTSPGVQCSIETTRFHTYSTLIEVCGLGRTYLFRHPTAKSGAQLTSHDCEFCTLVFAENPPALLLVAINPNNSSSCAGSQCTDIQFYSTMQRLMKSTQQTTRWTQMCLNNQSSTSTMTTMRYYILMSLNSVRAVVSWYWTSKHITSVRMSLLVLLTLSFLDSAWSLCFKRTELISPVLKQLHWDLFTFRIEFQLLWV